VADKFATRVSALAGGDEFFDEILRVSRQKPLAVPANGQPSANGATLLGQRRATDVAEFKRAIAANQRYEDLKRSGSTKLFADLPRLVFNEFYSFEGTTERRSRGSNRVHWRGDSLPTSFARRSAVRSM
jgi:hypothetical protein